MKSSIFKNFNEVTENKDILKILNDIKNGVYKPAITYLRKSLADNKTEAAERAKKSLPAFTPSATFKGGRKMEFLTNYNALVVLDIDKITPEKLTESKEILKENPFVFAFFTSPSGNGLKIFIKVDSGKDEHQETFLKLQRYFEDILSLEIDKSGKDITRLCFFSYDPELFVNEACTIFSTHYNQSQEQTTQTSKTTNSQIPNTINYDVLYTHCVQFTEKKESFIDGNRNNFVYQLANNLNRKGVPESVALGYILADYDYNSQEVMAAVRSAYSNTADFNTDAFQSKQKNTKKNIHKEADQS